MKKEVFESLRNGEVFPSLSDATKPLPDEVIVLVEQNSSDYRVTEIIPLSDAVQSFNEAEENSVISFAISRFISWYARKNNVNVIASSVAKLM